MYPYPIMYKKCSVKTFKYIPNARGGKLWHNLFELFKKSEERRWWTSGLAKGYQGQISFLCHQPAVLVSVDFALEGIDDPLWIQLLDKKWLRPSAKNAMTTVTGSHSTKSPTGWASRQKTGHTAALTNLSHIVLNYSELLLKWELFKRIDKVWRTETHSSGMHEHTSREGQFIRQAASLLFALLTYGAATC